jgi:hypothetical protein
MSLKPGEELLVIGEGNMLFLKKIDRAILRTEFEEATALLRRKIKRLGITKKDLEDAIRSAR